MFIIVTHKLLTLARKRSFAFSLAFLLFGLFTANFAVSRQGGITGVTQKNGAGCNCHCNNSNASTTVTIATSATTFEVGQTYTFTVTVASSNGNAQRAGVNVAVANGSLTPGGDGLQAIGGELTHTQPKQLTAQWTFTYTAPNSAGQDIIYATGNAVNFDGQNGGGDCTDNWNNAQNFTINVTAPTKSLAVTKTAMNLGSRRVGTSGNDTMRIVSTGDVAITINSSGMKTGAPFSSSPSGSRSINPGNQEVNTVTFSPTQRGTFTDSLIITSNATTAADQRKAIPITGQGIQAVIGGDNTLDFGLVKANTTKDMTFTYQNSGDDTLFLNTPSITGAFTIQTAATPLTVLPGGSGTVTIRFSPSAKQAYTGTLSFTATNGVAGKSVSLTGNGALPQLSAANSLDYGNVRVSTPSQKNFTVNNVGNDTLKVSGLQLSGSSSSKFTITSPLTFNVLPSSQLDISMTYLPTAEETDAATLTIQSNDPNQASYQVSLIGKGVLQHMKITPTDTVNFGDVRIGSFANVNAILIQNTGGFPLGILGATISPNEFTTISVPSEVGGGATQAVTVRFTPIAEGTVTGSIIIGSNDISNSSDTVFLKGRGTRSEIVVTPNVNFGNVNVTKTKDATIFIKNLGSAVVNVKKYELVTSTGAFTFTDTIKHLISSNDSIGIQVRFTPVQQQTYTATVKITTDEGPTSTYNVSLSGTGIDSKLQVNVAELDFGEIDTAKVSAPKSFTITNTGTAQTTLTEVTLEGSSTFTMQGSPLPKSLAAGDSAVFEVTFAPINVQEETGTITIRASEGSPLTLNVRGLGKAVPVDTTIDTTSSVYRSQLTGVEARIYPNPTSNAESTTLYIIAERELKLGIELYSSSGVLHRSLDAGQISQGRNELPIPISGLSSGEYYIIITNMMDGSAIKTKFIITK